MNGEKLMDNKILGHYKIDEESVIIAEEKLPPSHLILFVILNNEVFKIYIGKQETIKCLKQKIFIRSNIPAFQQNLLK
jgi:hypothetical protein